ncbi:MAG: amino acid permease [Bacteroidetes bacterium]|nr:amino acid permease [Bacteroidota bacterium]MBL6943034.1 amino acid permease [Bacteroidales bacterium]
MSNKIKKFGAFSGVFTPSILTILGVIMYLRLGWVTGVAGLWGVIAIIILAHVISVTTGLSISSIATDKKIKAGGIYYILSRSLGLPMGGSIGITLFIGTALSISLYIVGFTDNFLSLTAIKNLVNITEVSLYHVRMTGSIVLIILVIIAFISTNTAIKTQFFILGAIFLSLVSIVVGILFFSPETASSDTLISSPISSPPRDFSFIQVFAIFFPAVTGFTAGVAMSGDLKDPKTDIPKGTLYAIFTGFVIYSGLALLFYFFVDNELLVSDYNFLVTVAWIPFLVIAGIWGATLSSALGGILGGPRIIQAVAQDKIVPKILGRGVGKNKEPRNALIFTFILSELGVLIGDLNIIASIVSMFYLTAYGFINISFALEKWASTDFRPSFRIPIWVGVLGFFATFFVMIQLDVISMLGAMVILVIIYYIISKKQLSLAIGDVWQSVWASVIRKMLTRLDQKQLNERNWRANILLFSGSKRNRPHLIEFAKYLVGQHGMISNFDLILNSSSQVLFPKHKQAIPEDEMSGDEGIFSRRQECSNIYEGIKSIAATYGFSGVEPNTVLLGWARQTNDPMGFAQMLKYLTDLDLNIVMLDYDSAVGFGDFKQIDVWLRGGSNNGNLVLSLIKFIRASYEWRNVVVRLMIINNNTLKEKQIIRDTKQVLDSIRMDAEIRIVTNEQKLPVNHIIKTESANSDLIFLGIADVQEGHEMEFIERADYLYKDLGTIALVKASSFFKELKIGL